MRVGQRFSPYRIFVGPIIPECLLSYDKISVGAKVLLAVINRFIGKNDDAWPAQPTLAKTMGCSVRTIGGYIAELQADGFIEVEQRGLGQTNIYFASWHPIFDEDVADLDRKKTADQDQQETSDHLPLLYEESHVESSQEEEKDSTSTSDQGKESVNEHILRRVWEKNIGRLKQSDRKRIPELWIKVPPMVEADVEVEVVRFAEKLRDKSNKIRDPLAMFMAILSKLGSSGPTNRLPPPRRMVDATAQSTTSPAPSQAAIGPLCEAFGEFILLWREPCDGCGQEFPAVKVEHGKQEWCSRVRSGEISEATLPMVMDGLRRHRASAMWHNDNCKFVPGVAAFLGAPNGTGYGAPRWNDTPKAFRHPQPEEVHY